MTDKQMELVKKIRKKIGNLKKFLGVISPISGNRLENYMSLKIKTETSFSLFGSRFYGIGNTKEEIKIPPSVFEEIKEICKAKQIELEEEFRLL